MKMFNAIFGGMLLCAHLSFAQAYETDLFTLLDNADKSVDQIDSVVDAAYEEEIIDSVQVEEEVAQEGAANLIEEEFNLEPSNLALGISSYDSGDYEKAETIFEVVLKDDPYNRTAMTYLRKIAAKISSLSQERQFADRARALAAVEQSWSTEAPVFGLPVTGAEDKAQSAEDIAVEEMSSRVKSIQIPSLDFRDADIRDVVLFLTETCRRQDEQGINILTLGMDEMMTGSITISIRDLSLFEALQYITEMASLKL